METATVTSLKHTVVLANNGMLLTVFQCYYSTTITVFMHPKEIYMRSNRKSLLIDVGF